MRAPTRRRRSVPGRSERQTMTFSGMGACSRPWVRRYSRPRAYLLGGGAQGELAEHVEIALAEEVGEGLLDFFGA
jgi:hypothetical protein